MFLFALWFCNFDPTTQTFIALESFSYAWRSVIPKTAAPKGGPPKAPKASKSKAAPPAPAKAEVAEPPAPKAETPAPKRRRVKGA